MPPPPSAWAAGCFLRGAGLDAAELDEELLLLLLLLLPPLFFAACCSTLPPLEAPSCSALSPAAPLGGRALLGAKGRTSGFLAGEEASEEEELSSSDELALLAARGAA